MMIRVMIIAELLPVVRIKEDYELLIQPFTRCQKYGQIYTDGITMGERNTIRRAYTKYRHEE